MTSAKVSGFWTPSPPCPNFALTYGIEFTQPPLLHLLLAQPPTPHPPSVWTSYVHRPKAKGERSDGAMLHGCQGKSRQKNPLLIIQNCEANCQDHIPTAKATLCGNSCGEDGDFMPGWAMKEPIILAVWPHTGRDMPFTYADLHP